MTILQAHPEDTKSTRKKEQGRKGKKRRIKYQLQQTIPSIHPRQNLLIYCLLNYTGAVYIKTTSLSKHGGKCLPKARKKQKRLLMQVVLTMTEHTTKISACPPTSIKETDIAHKQTMEPHRNISRRALFVPSNPSFVHCQSCPIT